ncbi:MAG: ribonuclease Z [Prevotellaceae bacterium]|nr:ribonuclease Z [Prevotellaceae bacterium]
MIPFSVHILGCGSANPLQRHRPSSQVLSTRGKLFMVDCGEGTQVRFSRQGLSLSRLGHIFVTHAHGDHCFGLPGLINTMGLLGRTAQLHVHAPEELRPYVEQAVELFCQHSGYEVIFHSVDTTQYALIHEDRSLEVWSLPLSHSVPCCGYLFREKLGPRHIRREMIDTYDIPVCYINNIKAGASFTLPDGTMLPNSLLTTPPTPTRSWAYVSDTAFRPQLAPLLRGVDLLYHEATFAADDEVRARHTFHSTSSQAATIAKLAGVHRLCIGHFSARLGSERALLGEARSVFPDTILANEGMEITVGEERCSPQRS